MTDFSKPRRMGASAFFIILLKTLKEIGSLFLFVLVMQIPKVEDRSLMEILGKILISFGIIVAFAVVVSFVRYYIQKFHIEGDKLVYSSNFLSKNTTSIPLSKVHNVRTDKGLFYRIFDVRGISFDTLAGKGKEVELILDETDWRLLLNLVKTGENIADAASYADTPKLADDADGYARQSAAFPSASEAEEDIRVGTFKIFKGALCQNHLKGLAVIGALLVPVIDHMDQLGDDVIPRVLDFASSHVEDAAHVSLIQWCCLMVVACLIVVVAWTGNAVVRYGEMLLRLTPSRLTMESGVISRFTIRLARDKATILEIKENILERLLHCQTIVLLQASNATDKKNKSDIRIYGSMLGKRLRSWWLGENTDMSVATVASAKSGRGLFLRKFIPNVIIAAIVTGISIYYDYAILTSIISAVYLFIMATRSLMAWRHSGIILTDLYVQIRRGNIARISDYINYRDIESVSVRSTPFTRFLGRVSLSIDTNARSFRVYSLTYGSANRIRNLILSQS